MQETQGRCEEASGKLPRVIGTNKRLLEADHYLEVYTLLGADERNNKCSKQISTSIEQPKRRKLSPVIIDLYRAFDIDC